MSAPDRNVLGHFVIKPPCCREKFKNNIPLSRDLLKILLPSSAEHDAYKYMGVSPPGGVTDDNTQSRGLDPDADPNISRIGRQEVFHILFVYVSLCVLRLD